MQPHVTKKMFVTAKQGLQHQDSVIRRACYEVCILFVYQQNLKNHGQHNMQTSNAASSR